MKIYRIRSVYDEKGNNVYKQIGLKRGGSYFELRKQVGDSIPLVMEWAWGCKTKRLADYIPGSSPGMLFTKRAMDKLSPLMPTSDRYQVNLRDGTDNLTFYGVVVKGYKLSEVNMDHLLSLRPKHGYPVVSEVFKRAWEANGFTGMEFEEIDEIDDSAFAAAI